MPYCTRDRYFLSAIPEGVADFVDRFWLGSLFESYVQKRKSLSLSRFFKHVRLVRAEGFVRKLIGTGTAQEGVRGGFAARVSVVASRSRLLSHAV